MPTGESGSSGGPAQEATYPRRALFTSTLRARLEECALRGGGLVVAVSGGPDSTATSSRAPWP